VVNRTAKKIIDDAYSDSLLQEKQYWDLVNDDLTTVPTKAIQTLRTRIAQMEGNRVANFLQDLPPSIKTFLGRPTKDGFKDGEFAKGAKLGELQTLRSEVLREIRAERAKDAPDRAKISLLGDIQESLLGDMDLPGGDQLRAAINFSKDLNLKYRQGDVGRILGFERTGEGTVPELLTLESTLGLKGASGARAKVAVNSLLEATNKSPEMKSAMSDFLIDEFLSNSKLGSDFSPTSAARYMVSRKEVLSEFPELSAQMEAAINAGNAKKLAEQLKNPSQSVAALVIGGDVNSTLTRIIKNPQPGKAIKEIVALAKQDATGQAMPSLKKASMDWLLTQSESNGMVLGSKMKSALDDRAVSLVLKEVFSEQEIIRIKRIMNTAVRSEAGQKADPAQAGVLNDIEGLATELIRKTLAAGVGRNVARELGMGGTVQIPANFTEASNRLRSVGIDPARRLLIDAVTSQDDTLLKALLVLPGKNDLKAANRINAWAIGVLHEYGIHSLYSLADTPAQQDTQSQTETQPGM